METYFPNTLSEEDSPSDNPVDTLEVEREKEFLVLTDRPIQGTGGIGRVFWRWRKNHSPAHEILVCMPTESWSITTDKFLEAKRDFVHPFSKVGEFKPPEAEVWDDEEEVEEKEEKKKKKAGGKG